MTATHQPSNDQLGPLAPFAGNPAKLSVVLTQYWDVGTLAWIKGTQPGGGGGGAITIADGADVAQGTTTDAAWVAGAGTVISLLKKIASAGGGAVSIADGSDVAEGTTTDAAVVTDAAGTLSGKLRGLVKWAFERMPASLGQKAMAASLPVVVASDQSTLPVSGPLTDAQLRATPVPVSGTITANAGTNLNTSLLLLDATFTGRINTQGQKAMAASTPIVIASDQSTLPVSIAAPIVSNPTSYLIRLDEASTVITYVGSAAPGTATAAASWSIKRLDSTTGLVVLWAAGTAAFNQVWDNRAALAYS